MMPHTTTPTPALRWARAVLRWARGERGESSIALVLVVPVLLLAGFGLTVDWAGKVQASEEAVTIAQQAARAGANAGAVGELGASSRGASISPGRAQQAAQQYLSRAGVQGSVSANTQEVTVTTTVIYQPKFLPVGALEGHGVGRAELRPHIRN